MSLIREFANPLQTLHHSRQRIGPTGGFKLVVECDNLNTAMEIKHSLLKEFERTTPGTHFSELTLADLEIVGYPVEIRAKIT